MTHYVEYAIRKVKRGKAHRESGQIRLTRSGPIPVTVCQRELTDAEEVRLDSTAPEDRCKLCWRQP